MTGGGAAAAPLIYRLGRLQAIARENPATADGTAQALNRLGHYLPEVENLARETAGAGSITLNVDDDTSSLPWELLPLRGEPLGLVLPVRRVWDRAQANPRARHATLRRMVIVEPANPLPELPGIREESTRLLALNDELELAIRRWRLGLPGDDLDGLQNAVEAADILYFNGHHVPGQGLQLDGRSGQCIRARELLTGARVPRLCWINACESASLSAGGIARDLLEAGVPNVLGFAGPIRDSVASDAMRSLLENLLAGNTLEYAVWSLRRTMAARGNLDWPSLMLYGTGGPIFGPPQQTTSGRKEA
jgi:hypothetical protein